MDIQIDELVMSLCGDKFEEERGAISPVRAK
jgi:hypothetical protein